MRALQRLSIVVVPLMSAVVAVNDLAAGEGIEVVASCVE